MTNSIKLADGTVLTWTEEEALNNPLYKAVMATKPRFPSNEEALAHFEKALERYERMFGENAYDKGKSRLYRYMTALRRFIKNAAEKKASKE